MALPKSIEDLIPQYFYRIRFSAEDAAYVVSVDEIPGCMTHGDSLKQALEMGEEAVRGHLEVLFEQNQMIPIPLIPRGEKSVVSQDALGAVREEAQEIKNARELEVTKAQVTLFRGALDRPNRENVLPVFHRAGEIQLWAKISELEDAIQYYEKNNAE